MFITGLSPRGLIRGGSAHPRLTPWAAFCRRIAAEYRGVLGGDVVKKKAKGSSKGKAKNAGKDSVPSTQKPVDMVNVRENIHRLVGHSAEEIAAKVIEIAKDGQLASAKYLFEVVGVYPATEETKAKGPDSLAYALLKRMGQPTERAAKDDNPEAGEGVSKSEGEGEGERGESPEKSES